MLTTTFICDMDSIVPNRGWICQKVAWNSNSSCTTCHFSTSSPCQVFDLLSCQVSNALTCRIFDPLCSSSFVVEIINSLESLDEYSREEREAIKSTNDTILWIWHLHLQSSFIPSWQSGNLGNLNTVKIQLFQRFSYCHVFNHPKVGKHQIFHLQKPNMLQRFVRILTTKIGSHDNHVQHKTTW